jgi:hypothetical protein
VYSKTKSTQAVPDSLALFPVCLGGGILLAREIYGYGIAGLEQNCELVVILLLQQDQGAVDTGNQMTKEDLCVHENNNVPY